MSTKGANTVNTFPFPKTWFRRSDLIESAKCQRSGQEVIQAIFAHGSVVPQKGNKDKLRSRLLYYSQIFPLNTGG